MRSSAVISDCGRYRYVLTRSWDTALPVLLFVMLNPSIADATINDPTITRCVGFAKLWGFGGIRVVNLYALRATDHRELWVVPAPVRVGEFNDAWLATMASIARSDGSPIVVAWGAHNRDRARAREVTKLLGGGLVWCLGINTGGSPRHPLMQRADTPLEVWREAA